MGKGSPEWNECLLELVNDTGRAYLTHTRLAGRYVIRFSIGQTDTEWRHVEAAWRLMQTIARELTDEAA